ncbi:hypothetical protein ABER99_21245 [Paenibacillus glucanolyticus]|uniref:Copper amine oxidase-like N-terminal domain-containing protein n=1 Tax=Paenibacillus glucanolyticus TaxID=59843 RepID=A0A163G7X6_9BACL|nr:MULTISPECIES: hypothetical protein [Paenibacillus]KZS44781.1 hypothetical protein AWU65_01965 [Paenibacillus glucanolyticus]MDH6675694.1 sporulation protein YlmC with PRC-barrel domain [Paenibacillus sp. LBL]OMF64446.1 hypothetical protein BK142_31855 [Paenibacillus glucanolyticus]
MKKALKLPLLIATLVSVILFISPLAKLEAASNIIPSNAYASEAIAIFLDGQLVVTKEKTYTLDGIKKSGIYLPVKLLAKLKNVKVNYTKPITVKSDIGTFKLDHTNSYLYDDTTYITIEDFYKMTGLSGKYLYEPNSLFLWSDTSGKSKTTQLIDQINKVSDDLKNYMGKKVYIYKGEKVGHVIEIDPITGDSVRFNILLNNGKVIEEIVIGEIPDSFCTYFHYELMSYLYTGKYFWANKNLLPSSNPLLNIEKVYFKSIKMKGKDLIIQAKRASGHDVTFKLSFYDDPSEPIKNGFYSTNPKSVYTNWSSNVWTKITQQKISIGMSQDQVFLSWGAPDEINSYTSAKMKIDQWVYGRTYIHFHNGKLNSWTDF